MCTYMFLSNIFDIKTNYTFVIARKHMCTIEWCHIFSVRQVMNLWYDNKLIGCYFRTSNKVYFIKLYFQCTISNVCFSCTINILCLLERTCHFYNYSLNIIYDSLCIVSIFCTTIFINAQFQHINYNLFKISYNLHDIRSYIIIHLLKPSIPML